MTNKKTKTKTKKKKKFSPMKKAAQDAAQLLSWRGPSVIWSSAWSEKELQSYRAAWAKIVRRLRKTK